MKLLFLICLLFAAIYCQTTINIYNNGNGCNSSTPSTPAAPKRYRFGWPVNGGRNLHIWEGTYIQKVLEYVPSLQDKVDIVPIYPTNFTRDVLIPTLNCEYDVIFSDAGVTQQRLDLGMVFTDSIYFTANATYYTFYVNIPLGSNNGSLCGPDCEPLCSNYTMEDLYNYVKTNNLNTINFRYDSGSYRQQVVDDLQQQFTAWGYTGSINIYTYPTNILDSINYVVNASATTLEIVYVSIPVCNSLDPLTVNYSVARLISRINPPAAFPMCPKQTDLLDLLNSGIRQYRATTEICKNLEAFDDYCINDPPQFNELEDPCYDKVSTKC